MITYYWLSFQLCRGRHGALDCLCFSKCYASFWRNYLQGSNGIYKRYYTKTQIIILYALSQWMIYIYHVISVSKFTISQTIIWEMVITKLSQCHTFLPESSCWCSYWAQLFDLAQSRLYIQIILYHFMISQYTWHAIFDYHPQISDLLLMHWRNNTKWSINPTSKGWTGCDNCFVLGVWLCDEQYPGIEIL